MTEPSARGQDRGERNLLRNRRYSIACQVQGAVVLPLDFGGGVDLGEAVEHAMREGQDSDRTPGPTTLPTP